MGVLRDLTGADADDVSEHATATARALTHVMILHPVAAGLVSPYPSSILYFA